MFGRKKQKRLGIEVAVNAVLDIDTVEVDNLVHLKLWSRINSTAD